MIRYTDLEQEEIAAELKAIAVSIRSCFLTMKEGGFTDPELYGAIGSHYESVLLAIADKVEELEAL